LLRETSEGVKGQLGRVDAGQQSSVGREDFVNVAGDVGKLKEDMIVTMRMTGKEFAPSMKKGKKFDVPDGIIAHLTRVCGGNVHDRHVIDITSGSFEKETHEANAHSGAYGNDPRNAAENAANLEAESCFISVYRPHSEDILHTRNN
jgi:hypothetical protein